MALHMLTTTDNPHNPFTHFDEWYAYDTQAGHHTSAFLARVVRTSGELTEAQEDAAIEDAIDEIVRENVSGLYRKVTEGKPYSYIRHEFTDASETSDQ